MIPQRKWTGHPPEETLEEYAFGRLDEEQTAPLEEHILICSICQDRLRAVDEYILLMKTAARDLAAEPPWRRWVAPRGMWAAAGVLAALLIAGFGMTFRRAPAEKSARVELVAFRGADMATVPAGRRVDLAIDVSDLPGSPVYRVQVVDSTGQEEWSDQAAAPHGRLIAQVSRSLNPGVHWVRVSSAQGELLREFGLRAE